MDAESLDEFYEKVGTEKKEKIKTRPSRGELTDESPVIKNKNIDPGKIVQYSYFATGYLPSSSTVNELPAGCYRPCYSDAGIWLDPTKIVTDSLIQFPDTKSDLVISEIDHFWTLKNKFKEFGFCHKRGYLLWGPPGSGKSCTVAIIVSKMVKKGGLVIIADSPGNLSKALERIRSAEPEREIVVIWEDLDAVIERFGESDVLSILDGESQVANIVFIATTNYPEKLDLRITNRPSRFDRIEKIDMPNEKAREMYFMSKAGTIIAPDGTDLVKETEGMSIAHLREIIVGIWCQESDPQLVLHRLKKMRVKPNSGSSGNQFGLCDVAKSGNKDTADLELKHLKEKLKEQTYMKPGVYIPTKQ